jgi:plasmid replication initiation protein
MLKIAKNAFKKDKNIRSFTVTADELLVFFGLGKKNHDYLRAELRKLRKIEIEYNILNKDKKNEWGEFNLISGYSYNRGVIEFSFPHQIEKMILNPKMFGKINLVVIKSLRSRYSIALYELAEDYINAQIPKMTITDFRDLMGIEEKKYYKFSMLRKRVVDVAINEINESENISFNIDYELEKSGKKITHIKFTIHKKEEILQLKDRQKKFYGWKKEIIKKYKEQTICNNLTEIGYLKWTFFYINQDGLLGKIVDDTKIILDKEESLKVWEYLYQNPSKMKIEPITSYDILQKDFKYKKIKQVTVTALGGRVETKLEFIDFKQDVNKNDEYFEYFFIKIKQEDSTLFWTKKSFSFDEIVNMEFA